MNNPPMTAKEYLSQAYRIDQRINAKLEQAERLRELSRRRTVAYGGERVSHSRNVHRMEDTVVPDRSERALDREIDAFLDVKQEIRQTIALVADADCRLLLELRYLSMKRWGRHCGRMQMCRTSVYLLHRRALDMVKRFCERERSVRAMMRNKLPQARPCLQITGLAAQIAEKYGLRPVPYSAAPRVRHALPAAHADAQPQRANVGGQVLHRAWQLGSGPVRYALPYPAAHL